VQAAGGAWGGRGFGGRAVNRFTVQPKDIHIEGFTLAFQGQNLLERTVLKFANDHRYGLIGQNGAGKTALLRRIATGSVPGWPQHVSTYLVQQEGVVRDDCSLTSVLDTVLQSDIARNALLAEEAHLTEVSACVQLTQMRSVPLVSSRCYLRLGRCWSRTA
jgi:ATPase subunit of ABC transporter with duplicated ATPase domains